MKIQYVKEHVGADGTQHRKGEVATVSPAVGDALVKEGVARKRTTPAPTEKK
jgi:hypothetical protein